MTDATNPDPTDPYGAPAVDDELTPPHADTESSSTEANPGGSAEPDADTAVDDDIIDATSPAGNPE